MSYVQYIIIIIIIIISESHDAMLKQQLCGSVFVCQNNSQLSIDEMQGRKGRCFIYRLYLFQQNVCIGLVI